MLGDEGNLGIGKLGFGEVLRLFRRTRQFSQEQLAALSQLSSDAISSLERGKNIRPRPDTLLLLDVALDLTPPERKTFYRAAGYPAPQDNVEVIEGRPIQINEEDRFIRITVPIDIVMLMYSFKKEPGNLFAQVLEYLLRKRGKNLSSLFSINEKIPPSIVVRLKESIDTPTKSTTLSNGQLQVISQEYKFDESEMRLLVAGLLGSTIQASLNQFVGERQAWKIAISDMSFFLQEETLYVNEVISSIR
jgi:transcriptional regulator with XRE-family HTH domain